MKDFIMIKDHCSYCPKIMIAKVLSGARIDLLDVRSGSLRIKALQKQINIAKENIPIGKFMGHLINFARDIFSMFRFFGGS